MKKRSFLISALLITVLAGAFAQEDLYNLEFIQNKGQWDSNIGYKAEFPNGSFFLQKTGFSVMLNNTDDMEKFSQVFHGHSLQKRTAASPKSGTSPNQGLSGSTMINQGNVRSHIYAVEFVNARTDAEISGDKALDTYNNYFIGNDPAKWASNCKIYQAVVYKNIYTGVDLRYYTESGRLKYDMIIHPGADPEQIVLRYKGTDKLTIKKNQLLTQTSVAVIKETIPHTYQFNKEGRSELDCKYVLGADNTIHFKLNHYSKDATIIIDPSLIFSTFTGSRDDNWGYTATYDNDGNFYSGSIVLSEKKGTKGFPVSPGAYQSSYIGGDTSDGGWTYDMAIMKFSSNGRNRMYATYIGGVGNEQPHSLIVDNAGNLIIAGRTSSPDYPKYPAGTPVIGRGGHYDILLTKLNATGTALIGSRTIGGTGNDGVNIAPKYSTSYIPMGQHSLRLNYGDDGRSEVILDSAGFVYLASCTQSTDFPTINAFQKTNGGAQDGVFIKASPDLSNIITCTYLGGSNDDAAFALALSPTTNNIYIGGGTASRNFPGTNNGSVLQKTNTATIDGFVSMLSNDGSTLIKTTYIGTEGIQVVYGVQFGQGGFPFIMGTTTSDNWPIVNAAWSQPKGKQYIAKLQSDLSGWVYSTVFGKGSTYPDISPTAFLVDRCENVYVAGWGGGIEREGTPSGTPAIYENSNTFGLPLTPDAIKDHTDGDDFYFFVMKRDAVKQLYGSYFGQDGGLGDHVDGGTSRFDKQGIIYEAICANCYGDGYFLTTPNVWAPKNGTGIAGCNLAAVKIAFNFAGVGVDLRSSINGVSDSSGCIPLNVTFTDTVQNAKQYIWNFGDGSPDTSTSTYTINHIYNAIGRYRVRLIAVDSTTCNIRDTTYTDIQAKDNQAFLAMQIKKLPPCQALSYSFSNNSTFASTAQPFGPNSFAWDFGDGSPRVVAGTGPVSHSYISSGSYNVKLILLDTNYCNAPDSISVILSVASLVKARFETPPSGCAPYNAFFSNTSEGGQTYVWTFGDGSSSTDQSPSHLYPDTGSYTIKLIVIDSNTCNIIDSTQTTISVRSKPAALFTDQPIPPVTNIPTSFFNNSTGATHYKWLFGDGDSVLKNNADTVIHQYRRTGTFTACLIAFNQYECSDTACGPVETIINPLLDVPNAFTPGRFGQNAIVHVKGFGIAKMTWRIYNRWGQKIFESNDQDNGWDGTFKGTPQPMDVYAYTLEAVYFDGTRTTRKGDITLIR